MIQPTARLYFGDNKPLSVLNRLLGERSDALNECMRDSTYAVAIQCLKSIRAATRDARKTRRFKIKIEDTGWYVGFSNKERKYVIRSGPDRKSPRVEGLRNIRFYTIGKPQRLSHVYKVTFEKPEIEPFYFGAESMAFARQKALKFTRARIDKTGTLARNALGVAMNKISLKNDPLGGSEISKNKSSTAATVTILKDGGGDFVLKVTDNLDYATDALRGGESAMNTALMKAANKVAGYINHIGGKDITERIPTPFPEVKRKR